MRTKIKHYCQYLYKHTIIIDASCTHGHGLCLWTRAYILIGPCGGGAQTGHTHTGALLTATLVATVEIVEPQFAAVTVFPLHVFLQAGWRKRWSRKTRG